MNGPIDKGRAGLLMLALAIGVGLLLWLGRSDRAAEVRGLPAPAFRIPRLAGQGVLELSAMRGDLVLVHFWETWCPPCQEEMPVLARLAKEFEAQGVRLVSANTAGDAQASSPAVEAWVAQTIPEVEPYVGLADPQMRADYGISQVPTLVVIDRKGRIRASYTSAISERLLRRKIETFLQDG